LLSQIALSKVQEECEPNELKGKEWASMKKKKARLKGPCGS